LVDIFIVDLKLKETKSSPEDKSLGDELVRVIARLEHVGIIVYSTEPVDIQSPFSLADGADDYIPKGASPQIIRARVLALWRKVKRLRSPAKFAHANRVFQVGRWRFAVDSRDLTNELGEPLRVSTTEQTLLSYLVTIEDHEIDREHFNVSVMGRETHHDDRRLDNVISRLRAKLGDSVKVVPIKNVYKLVSVFEVTK
jgi:DNA-binding response OmpR family regulator